jgi:hypothetical protein
MGMVVSSVVAAGPALLGTHCKKSDLCTLRKETARPQSQFPHLCICERFIYYHDRSTCSRIGGPILGTYTVNRLQKHKCRNWDWSHAVSFLGIFVSNFRYIVFAVWVHVASPCFIQLKMLPTTNWKINCLKGYSLKRSLFNRRDKKFL